MTLNILLGSSQGIYQSSDYRISALGSQLPLVEEHGAKQLSIRTFNWAANIEFAGIAHLGQYSTRVWIVKTLESIGDHPFAELIQALTDAGTKALGKVPEKERRLTITLGAYADARLQAALISNWEFGPWAQLLRVPDHQLRSFTDSLDQPRLIITGVAQAVPKADRTLLLRSAHDGHDPQRVADLIKWVHNRALRHPTLGKWVSPQCSIRYLARDGSGKDLTPGGAGIPDTFLCGFNLGRWLREHLRPASAPPGLRVRILPAHVGRYPEIRAGEWYPARREESTSTPGFWIDLTFSEVFVQDAHCEVRKAQPEAPPN